MCQTIVRTLLVSLIVGGINFPIPFLSIELSQKASDSTLFLIFQLISIIFVDLTILHFIEALRNEYNQAAIHWMLLWSVPMLSAMLFMIALFFVNTGQNFQPRWIFYYTFVLIFLATFFITAQIVVILYDSVIEARKTRFYSCFVVPFIFLSLEASVVFPCVIAKDLPQNLSIWMWISVPMYSAFLLFALAFFSVSKVVYKKDISEKTKKVRILYLATYFPFAVFWVIRAVVLQRELPADHPARLFVVYDIVLGSWTAMPIVLQIFVFFLDGCTCLNDLPDCLEKLWYMRPFRQNQNNDDNSYNNGIHPEYDYDDYYYDGPLPDDDDIDWDVGIGYQPPNQQTLHRHNIIKIQLQELKETQCLICWEDFAAGDDLVGIEGCGHPFHAECLKTWTEKLPHCPTCKIDVKAEYFEVKQWGSTPI